ncbi:MAG TPA: metallophosphoesterase family protein [Bryobacteraceae bacterium]|nr:metallophosphoesterase family protein [Bryobacteraceae bacterium]
MYRISAFALLLFSCFFTDDVLAQGVRISHGPMLGHVTSDSIWIWARTSSPGQFRIRYGSTPGRLDQVSNPVTTVADRDNTGWLRLQGLRPNTRYYYRPVTDRDTGEEGSFVTLPSSEEYRNSETNPRGLFNFSFQFGSCANQKPGSGTGPGLPAYGTMLRKIADQISFSIMNGDWLYEDKREFTVDAWRAQVGISDGTLPRILQIAPSLAGVWENYKYFLERGANLAAWHRVMPSYYTPDDHEILNDVFGTAEVGRRDRRTVFRDIGMQAWFDYLAGSQPAAFPQPIQFGEAKLTAGSDVLVATNADFTKLDASQISNVHVHWGGQYAGVDAGRFPVGDGDPNAGVYELVEVLDNNRLRIRPAAKESRTSVYSLGRMSFSSFRVGNVEFFLLDTRSIRDLQDTNNPNKPGTSLLGRRQREWLIKSMKESDADFFFIASSVNVTIPHQGPPGGGLIENKDDAWTAFLEEREQMIRFWDSLGKPVMVMTGDLHNSWAVKITDRVWEFASGPLGSQNHPARSEGGRPANGEFDSRGRKVDIRWSSYIRDDMPAQLRKLPYYAVARVNNVFDNPVEPGKPRWVAFPRPHVLIQYYDGLTGELLYAEPVHGSRR